MRFVETALPGAYIVEPERLEDERGFFARAWCRREFQRHGLNADLCQCNISSNIRRGTLRGMHFQLAPFAEVKLVRCTAGAIYDVIIDLRPTSATFKRWVSAELTRSNHRMLYVPEGLAHGFQTLVDDTEVFYQMSAYHAPEFATGVRWNDPAFGVRWPDAERPILSRRDATYQDFQG